jgi:hypothetical protein
MKGLIIPLPDPYTNITPIAKCHHICFYPLGEMALVRVFDLNQRF